MATATETRGKRAASTQPDPIDADQEWTSLLMGGASEVPDGAGAGSGDELDEDDELGLDDDESEDEEDEGEGEDDGNATDEDDGAESEPAGEKPAAADDGLSEYVNAWASKVRAKPLSIMQVPANRRAAVLKGAFAAERAAATEALREPLARTLEQVTQQAYLQGKEDARAELDGDAEFEEVRDLAENDLAGFGQLAHTPEGQAKVRRYLERLEAEKNPAAGKTADAIRATAARLTAKVRGNPAAMAELQAKERANPGRYAATAEGLEALTEDVAEALANARVAAASKADEPEKKAAEARLNGAQHRQRLPRTAGGEGRGGGRGVNDDAPGDYMDFIGRGFAEAKRRK